MKQWLWEKGGKNYLGNGEKEQKDCMKNGQNRAVGKTKKKKKEKPSEELDEEMKSAP